MSGRPHLLIEKAQLFGVLKSEVNRGWRHTLDSDFAAKFIQKLQEQHEYLEAREFIPRVVFTFKNCGKGPALIHDLVGLTATMAKMPNGGDLSGCVEANMAKIAFAPGDVEDVGRACAPRR